MFSPLQKQADVNKQRVYLEQQLDLVRSKRLTNEIKLLERSIRDMEQHRQHMNNNEQRKKQYSKLRDQLETKRRNLMEIIFRETMVPRFEKNWMDNNEYVFKTDITLLRILNERRMTEPNFEVDFDSSRIIDPPKYEIFINYAYPDNTIVERIKNILPQWCTTHIKGHFSSRHIKICLDNTSKTVIALINRAYEFSSTCQADLVHIFKRQFPLILVITDKDFLPSTNWLTIVWNAPTTQKVLSHSSPEFEEDLRNANTNTQWNLSFNRTISQTILPTFNDRSKRFLGHSHEWNIVCSNSARVSESYRQLITDPLRITTNIKLCDIYYKYIRVYFKYSDVMTLFEKAANENNMRWCLEAYTKSQEFSETLNHHLAANILFYFGSTINESVDYQLVKCLVDFVALCIYRYELEEYLHTNSITVYRRMTMISQICCWISSNEYFVFIDIQRSTSC